MEQKQESQDELFLSSDKAPDAGLNGDSVIQEYLARSFNNSFGEMCFSINNGRVVFGLPLKELSDSFIVAMPAVLVSDDGRICGKRLVAEPLIRIYKSNLLFTCKCPDAHRHYYYEYLINNAEAMPEVLTESSIEHLTRLLSMRPNTAEAVIDNSGDEDDLDSDESGDGKYTLPYNNKTRH